MDWTRVLDDRIAREIMLGELVEFEEGTIGIALNLNQAMLALYVGRCFDDTRR